jgi:hypothetical protein
LISQSRGLGDVYKRQIGGYSTQLRLVFVPAKSFR